MAGGGVLWWALGGADEADAGERAGARETVGPASSPEPASVPAPVAVPLPAAAWEGDAPPPPPPGKRVRRGVVASPSDDDGNADEDKDDGEGSGGGWHVLDLPAHAAPPLPSATTAMAEAGTIDVAAVEALQGVTGLTADAALRLLEAHGASGQRALAGHLAAVWGEADPAAPVPVPVPVPVPTRRLPPVDAGAGGAGRRLAGMENAGNRYGTPAIPSPPPP
jgi:hypothetical protein